MEHTAGEIDGVYSMDDPWIRRLLKKIHDRGHEVGLHLSYNTFRILIRRALNLSGSTGMYGEGIDQKVWGGRQHFLRWENPTTWQNWEDAGLDYDSTLGLSHHTGFRCGTCFDYPVFNLVTRTALKLRERPLIVMDSALLENSVLTSTSS